MMASSFDVFAPQSNAHLLQMHDPLCLASVLFPNLITWESAYVDVELGGALTLGKTVGYFHPSAPQKPNALVAIDVDAERFIALFLERVSQAFP